MKKLNLVLFAFAMVFTTLSISLNAQQNAATVTVCITNFAVANELDCDGAFNDSDFQVDFGGNNFEQTGDNGPFSVPVTLCETLDDCVTPGGTIDFTWSAEEDDGLGDDGETGPQTISIDPTSPPSSNQMTTVTSTGDGCDQTYTITWSVTNITTIPAMADNVCDAIQVIPGAGFEDYAWCNDYTLEAGEVIIHDNENPDKTAWFYFVAPSRDIEITTDGGNTSIGTEFALYHSANGVMCDGVNICDGLTVVKSKFDYFSDHDFADDDIPVISPNAQAAQDWDCGGTGFGPGLIPGEVYYIQMGSDEAVEGIISIAVNDDAGGTDVQPDVPCTAFNADPFIDLTQNEDGITAEEFDIPTGCAYDDEFPVDDPSSIDYHPNDGSQDMGSSTVWMSFTAPNSGRIYAEFNCPLQGEQAALYTHDPAFGPAVPASYSCADVTGVPDDAIQGNGWADSGSLGGGTAIIEYSCLEPGYTYYIVIDEPTVANCDIDTWIYDPSGVDAANNNPDNDIMCLALADAQFEIPVNLVGNCGAQNANGDNTRACIETLAGEPQNGGGHTNWHYFTVPPSGSVEIDVANGSIAQANFNVYETSDGTAAGCYGGLSPSVYEDAAGACSLAPCVTGSSSGGAVTKCCLTPGDVLAVQIDGGAVGDMGSYTITVNEIDVDAGAVSYTDPDGDAVDGNTTDPTAAGPAVFCNAEVLTPSTAAVECPNGDYCSDAATCDYPLCMGVGYAVHDTPGATTPGGIATIFATIDPTGSTFPNDGSTAIPTCQVVYVSPVVDDDDTNSAAVWGDFCTSSRVGDAAPVVFLTEMTATPAAPVANAADCAVSFDVTGGLPCFDSSMYDYSVGGTSITGSTSGTVSFVAPSNAMYPVTITDGEGCSITVMVDATACTPPACTLTNLVASNIACSGDNATLDICFDAAGGDGSYTATGTGVTGTMTGATDGNVCIAVTVTGPTVAGNLDVNVQDGSGCMGTAISVAIPECPMAPNCNIPNGTWSK